MPYSSIAEAKKASFPTSADDIALSLAQINKLAEIYDSIKKKGETENPFAVAWKAWKKLYKKEDGKWVKKQKSNTISMVNACIQANAQRKKFEGNDYQVVPVIALVEGVHSGSAGAAYYPGEEISKYVAAWNGVPLPVQHPMDADGNYVSCNSPETIEKQSVGYFFNAHWEDSKLKGELWINIEKAKKIAPEVLDILSSGKLLEVSTSFFSDQDYVSGEWGGENYEMVIRNIRPDHLALLPGGEGACSVKDGCGAPRVNEGGGEKMDDKAVGKVKAYLTQIAKSLGFKVQEVSHEETRDQIQKVLDGYDTKETVDMPISHFVREVYEDHFIYEQYSQDGTKLFKQSYKKGGDNTIKFEKKPIEVRQETEYISVKSNISNSKGGEKNMSKIIGIVTALIANELTSFVEGDREFLEGLTEDQLGKLTPKVNEAKHPVEKDVMTLISSESSPFEEKDKEMLSGLNECQFKVLNEKYPEKKEDPKPKVNEEDKPITFEELISKASPEMQEMITNGVDLMKKQKELVVKELLTNKRNTFTEDQLKSKKLDELQALASLAQVDVDYSGNGGSVKSNEGQGEVLTAPTLEDFKNKK